MADETPRTSAEGGRRNTILNMDIQAGRRLRGVSVSATQAVDYLLRQNPAQGMWAATGTAIAHAPNVGDLRTPVVGGDSITFDVHGHSARPEHPDVLKQSFLIRVQSERRESIVNTIEDPTTEKTPSDRASISRLSVTEDEELAVQHLQSKHPWTTTVKHGLRAAWKFFTTPTGFLITIYGLNVVAWGAMLFFLELHAAPAMNHPDNGNADSSPRKIWLEIDSQILNALFCLTAWGLAPWRFRDLWRLAVWRCSSGPASKRAIAKLAEQNKSWFRMRECDMDEDTYVTTFSGQLAPPTATWKMDFVVWCFIFNTLFQVGMAYYMWAYNRIDRPNYGVGLFIGLGCFSSLLAGLMSWWEGRKIKLTEGPKIVQKESA